jgi:peptide subunit release factor 1 (eRF1)
MAQDYQTFRVPVEDYENAIESKRDDETWGEFVQRCTENPPRPQPVVPVEDIADELADVSLDAGAGASMDGVDSDELAREVAARIDYTELASKVAEQVIGEMGAGRA